MISVMTSLQMMSPMDRCRSILNNLIKVLNLDIWSRVPRGCS